MFQTALAFGLLIAGIVFAVSTPGDCDESIDANRDKPSDRLTLNTDQSFERCGAANDEAT